MSWDCLSEEIGQMFEAHSWHADHIQLRLEEWAAWRQHEDSERHAHPVSMAIRRERLRRYREANPHMRKNAVAYTKWWREKNRDKARANQRAANKRARERAKVDQIFGEKFRAQRNASKRRHREKNLEKRRETDRINASKYRARKRERMQVAA